MRSTTSASSPPGRGHSRTRSRPQLVTRKRPSRVNFYEGGCQEYSSPHLGVVGPDIQVPRDGQLNDSLGESDLSFLIWTPLLFFYRQMRFRDANQGSCSVASDMPTTLLSGTRGPSQYLVVRGGIGSTQGLLARNLFDTLPRPFSLASCASQPGLV